MSTALRLLSHAPYENSVRANDIHCGREKQYRLIKEFKYIVAFVLRSFVWHHLLFPYNHFGLPRNGSGGGKPDTTQKGCEESPLQMYSCTFASICARL